MATPHKATPEQWEQLEDRAADHKFFFISSCVAELRSRIEALEAAANALADNLRDALEAAANALADHLRDAPEMVATDEELIKDWDVRNGDHLARIRFIYNLGRQHGAVNSATEDSSVDEPRELAAWLRRQGVCESHRQLYQRAADLLERTTQPEPVGPTDEELFCLEDLRDAWNAQADALIRGWDELGMDEIICFAQQQALARYGRLAAAEQRIQALEGNRQAILDSSPAPAGELVQSVGAAICSIVDWRDTPLNWAPEARAAILAVAKWFDAMGYGATASILLQEVQRNG